jgi:hypothetical protein
LSVECFVADGRERRRRRARLRGDADSLDDQAIHPDLHRFYAERIKAKAKEIKSSHLVIVSHAAEVARLIDEAA